MTRTLTTYLDLGRNQASRALVRARPPRAGPRVTVAALSGLHAGRQTTPDGDTFLISGEVGAQVFLLDPDVDGVVLQVRAERSMVGPFVRIQTNSEAVTVGGMGLAPGQLSAPQRLPTEVRIGAVRLGLSNASTLPVTTSAAQSGSGTALSVVPDLPPGAVTRDVPVLPRWRVAAAGILATGFIAAGWLADRGPAAGAGLVIVSAGAAPAPAAVPVPETDAAEKQTAAAGSSGTLIAMIAESPLGPHLQAATKSDGALDIHGDVPAAMMPLWQEMHRRHDDEAGPPIVSNVRALPPLAAFPAIATVRHGADPVVIFSDGTRARVGTLIDGWTLDAIAPGSLTLSRAGDIETLTY